MHIPTGCSWVSKLYSTLWALILKSITSQWKWYPPTNTNPDHSCWVYYFVSVSVKLTAWDIWLCYWFNDDFFFFAFIFVTWLTWDKLNVAQSIKAQQLKSTLSVSAWWKSCHSVRSFKSAAPPCHSLPVMFAPTSHKNLSCDWSEVCVCLRWKHPDAAFCFNHSLSKKQQQQIN